MTMTNICFSMGCIIVAVALISGFFIAMNECLKISEQNSEGISEMGMSKKHYEATAAIIADTMLLHGTHCDEAHIAIFQVASDLATMFKADNARFDRSRFLHACGVN